MTWEGADKLAAPNERVKTFNEEKEEVHQVRR